MSRKNYYEILGLDDNATSEEIKKAYRQKAKEFHPDKGGDENIFKDISEAYDVLGNDNKRKNYDNTRKYSGHGNINEELLNSFMKQQQKIVPDKIITLELSIFDSYKASNKTLTYMKNEKCETCNGQGGERVSCTDCNGSGFIIEQYGSGFLTQILKRPCDNCRSKGFTFKTHCNSCHGSCTKQTVRTIDVAIPHGIDSGNFIRLRGFGDYVNDGVGDLILKIMITPDTKFEKIDNDLVYNHYFNLTDLDNDDFIVKHPDGDLNVKYPIDMDTSKPIRIKNRGFKIGGVLGDLYIKFYLKYTKNRKTN